MNRCVPGNLKDLNTSVELEPLVMLFLCSVSVVFCSEVVFLFLYVMRLYLSLHL